MSRFTLQSVRNHCQKGDIWVIRNNKVYDVTEFLKRHPGGEDIILSHAYSNHNEVTQVMTQDDVHKHSSSADKILDKYCIGVLLLDANSNNKENGVGLKRFSGDILEDELIDWNKPVLWQVGQLGTNYWDWCHRPVDKTSLRLFYSDFVEYFSDTPWYVIPIVWIPVVLYLLFCSFEGFLDRVPITRLTPEIQINVMGLPILFIFGFLLWTFVEYTLHRWLFHMQPPENSPFLITFHFLLHGQHHKVPFNRYRLVFPPVAAFVFVVLFYSLLLVVFPKPVAHTIMGGGILGYVCYDLIHYYLHYGTPTRGTYFHRLQRYHVKHHFQDQMRGFGISSKLWDYPFHTLLSDKTD